MDNGHYWVCDQEQNCREISGLWEAEEYIREREVGVRNGCSPWLGLGHLLNSIKKPPCAAGGLG